MPLLLLSISPSYYWSFSLRLFSPMAIWRVYLAFTSFLYDSPRFSINSSYSWILSKYSSSIFSALSRSNAIPLFSISRLYIFRLAYSKLSCKFSSSSCLSLRSLSISRTDAAVLGSCLVVGVKDVDEMPWPRPFWPLDRHPSCRWATCGCAGLHLHQQL